MKIIGNSKEPGVTIIGSDAIIEGGITAKGDVRIDGQLKGNVLVGGVFFQGEKSEITGNVKAKEITLAGIVHGNCECEGKLVLEKSAVLNGDFAAHKLVVEEGAKFSGSGKVKQP